MSNSDADDVKESPSEGTRLGHRVLDENQSDSEGSGPRGDEYVNGGHRRELTAQNILQVQQQQSQGAAVNWERFLHVRSIKVLLVENDDCTRHIVTALLRNCSYEVIEAVHGAHAWKILEDLTSQVDLVLTEVVTPCLSGVGLLYKIMNHQTRKNIPVIMMSSHDSMGLVFKCLSKGAVDFLVKPIRKNELKNLWQHVWRRCHSSSGSGSESGTQTQNSIHTNNSEKSDGSSSNAGENDGSDDFNNDDESDDGSGSQSSWTKHPLPENISQVPSSTNQVAKSPDIKSAQAIQPNVESYPKNQGQGEDQCVYKDPLPDNTNHLDSEPPADIRARVTGAKTNDLLEVPSSPCSSRMKKVDEDPWGELHGNKHNVIDIASSHSQMIGREFEPPREFTSRQLVKNGHMDNPSEKTIELSSKRLRGIKGSEVSAFSRYNTSTSAPQATQAPQGITGSSYRNDDSPEDGNKDSFVHTNGKLVFPVSVSSNNIEMGSATSKSFVTPILHSSDSASAVNVALKPVKNGTRHTPQFASQHMPMSMQASTVLSPTSGVQLGLQIQHPDVHHHEHHYHEHHYHHYHTFDLEHKLSSYEKTSMKKSVADAGHCGLLDLNVMAGYEVGDPDNCYLNRSAKGSNYGSNGGHGSNSAVNAGVNHGDSRAVDGRNEGRDASGLGNRVNESKSAQREAALLKFLQKRKERCFKKKVRYQNRKRLAEQRPHVRGQFVRQTDQDSSYEADE